MNDDHGWEEEQFLKLWLSEPPEWIARIEEHNSLSYGGGRCLIVSISWGGSKDLRCYMARDR
jgi:hypothetical protein